MANNEDNHTSVNDYYGDRTLKAEQTGGNIPYTKAEVRLILYRALLLQL